MKEIGVRQDSLARAIAEEDYQSAAVERDALDSLLLLLRRLELVQGEASRKVKYKLGALLPISWFEGTRWPRAAIYCQSREFNLRTTVICKFTMMMIRTESSGVTPECVRKCANMRLLSGL